MRSVALFVLPLVLASAAGAQAASPSSALLGTWETLDLDRNGAGGTLVFADKGSAAAAGGLIVNGRYTRQGDRLLVIKDDGTRYAMIATVSGDTLIQASADSIVRMVRVRDASADTGLVGTWSFLHKLPQGTTTGFVRFRADGGFHLRVPGPVQFGTYSVARSHLLLTFPPGPPRRGRFSLVGDTLTVAFPGSPPKRFVRVP